MATIVVVNAAVSVAGVSRLGMERPVSAIRVT